MKCLVLVAAFTAAPAVSAPAQPAILVVDATGGAGSHFTDVPPAVAQAGPGDSIVVRPGGYTGFTVDKGISVLGQPGARITQRGSAREVVTVAGLPANADCAVAGLELVPVGTSLVLTDCAGRVLIEDVQCGGASIANCARAWFRGCTISSPTGVFGSSASFVDSTLLGALAFGAVPGLSLTDSDVLLSRCTVTGGDFVVPAPAVLALGSRLTVTGDGSGRLVAGVGSTAVPAISGSATSSLVIDDDVRLVPTRGAPPVATGLPTTRTNLPSLRARGAPIGGVVTVDLFSEPGDAYVRLIGRPGNALAIPGLHVPFWLHPAFAFVDGGILGASGRVITRFRVPAATVLVGIPIAWQGAAGTASTARGIELSNADSYVHGL